MERWKTRVQVLATVRHWVKAGQQCLTACFLRGADRRILRYDRRELVRRPNNQTRSEEVLISGQPPANADGELARSRQHVEAGRKGSIHSVFKRRTHRFASASCVDRIQHSMTNKLNICWHKTQI